MGLAMVAYDITQKYSYQEGGAENKSNHKKFATYRLPDWVRHPLKEQPKKLGLLFPGEQTHYVGMLKEVRKKPKVQEMLAKAEDIFGFDVESLMKDGPASQMKSTGVNQPLIYVANCVAYEVLKERSPEDAEKNQAVAGYSVGEWSALYAAGVITFEQGCEIVKVRADALQELADEVEMEALCIQGVPQDMIDRTIKRAKKADGESGEEPEIYVARSWCPDGYVLAGRKSTVLKMQEFMQAPEVRLLPDHIHAAHTPMAKQAGEAVAEVLDRMIPSMNPPRCEVYLNYGVRVPPGTSPFDFADAMKGQLSEQLVWDSDVEQMLRWGIRQFIECGPGRSLKYAMSKFEHFREAPVEVITPWDFTSNVLV